jgi:hypothetical protein
MALHFMLKKLIELIKERVEFIAKNPQAGKPTNHSDTRELL